MLPLPSAETGFVVATPAQLDELAVRTAEIGRRIEEVAGSAALALRDVASALPGSQTAGAAGDAGLRCAELLRAEGAALGALSRAFAAAAQAYRSRDARTGAGFAAAGR